MPNAIKGLTYVKEDCPDFFTRIDCMRNRIIDEGELVDCGVPRNEAGLKWSEEVSRSKEVKDILENQPFHHFVYVTEE